MLEKYPVSPLPQDLIKREGSAGRIEAYSPALEDKILVGL